MALTPTRSLDTVLNSMIDSTEMKNGTAKPKKKKAKFNSPAEEEAEMRPGAKPDSSAEEAAENRMDARKGNIRSK